MLPRRPNKAIGLSALADADVRFATEGKSLWDRAVLSLERCLAKCASGVGLLDRDMLSYSRLINHVDGGL